MRILILSQHHSGLPLNHNPLSRSLLILTTLIA
jgi:hypothetical protein